MPLTSRDIPGSAIQREVAPNIWVSSEVPDGGYTVLRTGTDSVRVNVTKARASGQETALGRALAWLREHRGEPIIIAGPDAELIVQEHLR